LKTSKDPNQFPQNYFPPKNLTLSISKSPPSTSPSTGSISRRAISVQLHHHFSPKKPPSLDLSIYSLNATVNHLWSRQRYIQLHLWPKVIGSLAILHLQFNSNGSLSPERSSSIFGQKWQDLRSFSTLYHKKLPHFTEYKFSLVESYLVLKGWLL
jgi:hypothetical protein